MYKNKLKKLITCIGLAAVMMTQTVFAEVNVNTEPPANEQNIMTIGETDPHELYHFDLASYEGWLYPNSKDTTNGTITFNITDVNSGRIYMNAPSPAIQAEDVSRFYMWIKSDQTVKWNLYYQSSNYSGHKESQKILLSATGETDMNGYALYFADFSTKSNWSGDVKQLMIYSESTGSYTIRDAYLYTDTPVKNLQITASETEITEDGGEVTLTPTATMANGETETKANFITSSVNGKLTVNADGTATLKGQINGDVTVKVWREDCKVTDEVTVTISGQLDRIANVNKKIMFFGNSITKHEPRSSLGWTGNWGMAASSEDKDYVHRLCYYLEEKYGKGAIENLGIGGVYDLETLAKTADATTDFSVAISSMAEQVKGKNLDIIIVQLGENANTSSATVHERAMTELVTALKDAAPNAVVAISTPFWGGAGMISGATSAAKKLDLPIANLHTLNTDENKAIGQFTDPGVAAHPGDTGMDNIAKLYFEAINKKLSLTETLTDDITYTTTPKSIKFTDAVASIGTEYGTAQLTAKVLPEDASQDVVWSVDNKDLATIDKETGLIKAVNNGTVTVTATHKIVNTVLATREIEITNQTVPNTVTYDKNTDDEVENLPEPNAMAKLGYELSTQYPVRKYYTFAGWALTPDGDALGKTIDVTEDTTVYAKWEYANKWSFNTKDYLEGFEIENGFHVYVEDGYLPATHTAGQTPKFISPELNIDSTQYEALVVNLQNASFNANTKVTMTVKTEAEEKMFSKDIVSSDFTDYVFDLGTVSGTITGFEFTASNSDGAVVRVDEIYFRINSLAGYNANTNDAVANMPSNIYDVNELPQKVSDMIPVRSGYKFMGWATSPDSTDAVGADFELKEGTRLYAIWEKIIGDVIVWSFDDGFDGFESNYVASVEDGAIVIDNVKGKDPQFTSPDDLDVTINAEGVNYIRIRMKHSTDAAKGRIFFKTAADEKMTQTNSIQFDIAGKTNEYRDVFIDMSDVSGWEGTLKQLRVDAVDDMSAIGGKLMIDEIALMAVPVEETTLVEYDFEDSSHAGKFDPYGATSTHVVDYTNPMNHAAQIEYTAKYGSAKADVDIYQGELYRWSYKAMAPNDATKANIDTALYGTTSSGFTITGDSKPGAIEKNIWKTYNIMICRDEVLKTESKQPKLGWMSWNDTGVFLVDDYKVTAVAPLGVSKYSTFKDGKTQVDAEDGLNIFFNMALGTPDVAKFTLTDEFGEAVEITGVSAFQGNLVVDHKPLANSTEYTLKIAELKDKYGRKLENYELKFTTKADFDITNFDIAKSGTSVTITGDIVNNSSKEKDVLVKCWEYIGTTTIVHEFTVTAPVGKGKINVPFTVDASAKVSASVWADNDNIRPLCTSVSK